MGPHTAAHGKTVCVRVHAHACVCGGGGSRSRRHSCTRVYSVPWRGHARTSNMSNLSIWKWTKDTVRSRQKPVIISVVEASWRKAQCGPFRGESLQQQTCFCHAHTEVSLGSADSKTATCPPCSHLEMAEKSRPRPADLKGTQIPS